MQIISLPLMKMIYRYTIISLFNCFKHWRFIPNECIHQLSTIFSKRKTFLFYYTVSTDSPVQNKSFIPSFEVYTMPVTLSKQLSASLRYHLANGLLFPHDQLTKMSFLFFWELLKFFPTYFWTWDSQKWNNVFCIQ